jgi:SAM-dependent methyltransferase
MKLTLPATSMPSQTPLGVPVDEINYSVELLQRDEHQRAHIRQELALIRERYKIHNCVVLEVGCGLGHNLQLFADSNEVLGIEGLEDAAATARSQGLRVWQGDLASELRLPSNSVDWALCLDVLEHLVAPLSLLTELHRVLRNRGKLIINVPNHFDLSGRLKLLFGSSLDVHRFYPDHHDWDNPHLRFFTHPGILQLVKRSGFHLVDDRSSSRPILPKAALLERFGFGPLLRALSRRSPSLFSAGFFLIVEKRP